MINEITTGNNHAAKYQQYTHTHETHLYLTKLISNVCNHLLEVSFSLFIVKVSCFYVTTYYI